MTVLEEFQEYIEKKRVIEKRLGRLNAFPPCVGCGYCCLKSQCIISERKYGRQDICPALYWNGDQYRCNVWREIDGIGAGCCSSLNSWRKEVKNRSREALKLKLSLS